jgi:lactose/L-arabinose transport system ATP-binding protein
VQQVGAPLHLYRDPDNMFVAGFIGSPAMNFLKGKVKGWSGSSLSVELHDAPGRVFDVPASVAVAQGSHIFIGVRPENIGFQSVPGAAQLEVTAEFIEELGGTGYLHAMTASGEEITIECRGSFRPAPKDAVRLSMSAADMLIFSVDGVRIR